tara:strand:+ start:1129 stop:1323 length:195 start_codon:yes stop_codon:yes gene_type:complete
MNFNNLNIGDLVRWTKTGKISVYMGMVDDDGEENVRFYSAEYGMFQRWIQVLEPGMLEVVNEAR